MDGSVEAPLWIELFILLLLAATIVAIVARRAALPYSVALVLAGLGLASLIPGQPVAITPELILAPTTRRWGSIALHGEAAYQA